MDIQINISEKIGQGRTELELICDAMTALAAKQRALTEEYIQELEKARAGNVSFELSKKIEVLLAEGKTLTVILQKIMNA
ncbi:hypothetical protein [Dyadobacter alkalitolerans]|uniref:hypothetical protein n=1 Tax=Dyadobacter alkalitolerans TaxID=492736 RepID=UPI00047B8DE4|nr:hypothetical protein [Dyadobacter alkalitolerans]